MKHPGKLITWEGLDGSGKSTQLALEAQRLRGKGFRVKATREPGGTAVGQQVREIVLHAPRGSVTPLTELALMFAARAQHIEEVILPALRAGDVVLCDRFTDSSVAYQGYGRGIPLKMIQGLESMLCQGVRPDLTVILEIDPETGARRSGQRNRAASDPDTRFEQEGIEFFERVQHGYREIAQQEPGRIRLVDGQGSVAEVHERVRQAVDEFLKK
ncbi:MAG: dTMP kinase [Terriglobia bacterium]